MEKNPTTDKNEIQTLAGLTLRPERDSDREFISRLYASTRTREMELLNWSNEEKDHFLQSQFAAQHSHYLQHFPGSRFDVIEQRSVSIGRLYVAHCTDDIRIIDIALLPEHRCQGLGGVILQALLEQAATTGKSVSLHVEKFNPAVHLYSRLGFKPRGEDGGINQRMEWRGGPAR